MGKHLLRTAVFAVLGLTGLALWASGPLLADARIGVAFVARTTCSCVFVAGRDLDSCRRDWPAGAEIVVARREEQAVSAQALAGFVSARAEFEEGYGCTLR